MRGAEKRSKRDQEGSCKNRRALESRVSTVNRMGIASPRPMGLPVGEAP